MKDRRLPIARSAIGALRWRQRKGDELEQALRAEESAERERDKRYWVPLRKELETLRRSR